MKDRLHSYHFSIIKDHGWLWIVTLPFGLISWALPFVLVPGLIDTGLEQATALVIGCLFLGIPALLIGWIFVYSFMEMLITRVTFSESIIYHRTPLLIIPVFWRTRKIAVSNIEDINFFARYGTRFAILLTIHNGNKTRNYFLPRFKDQPDYLDEFRALQKDLGGSQPGGNASSKGTVKEKLIVDAIAGQTSPQTWNRLLKFFSGLLIFILILGCGYFCLSLPISTFQAFSAGASVGMALVLLCLIISLPILGQAVIWFFGRAVIVWAFDYLKINSDSLLMPPALQEIFRRWIGWDSSGISLTDFAFWLFFLLSILYSIDRLVRYIDQRSRKKRTFQNLQK